MMIGFVLLGVFLQAGVAAPAPATTSSPAFATTSKPAVATTSTSAPAEAPVFDRTIRILLQDGVQTASLILRDRYNLVNPETGEILRADEPPGDLVFVFAADAIEAPLLDLQIQADALDIVPTGNQPTQIKLSKESRDFPGGIRLLRRPEGGAVVSLMDMEDYLAGVVSSELPANFHGQAFRAQAIAARTYAWYARETSGLRRDWDVWATEKSQVYGSLDRQKLVPRAAEAVRDTRGIVATWSSPSGEKIFCTYFGSRCGGITTPASSPSEDGPIEPLAGGVPCPYCLRPAAYRWPQEPRFSKWTIKSRLANRYSRFQSLGRLDRVEAIETTEDGRALRIAVIDVDGRTLGMDAESFRLTVDPTGRLLQGTYFTIVDAPDAVFFTEGRGMGHGMGMCQYGADALARQGWDAAAILKHYYPGSELTRAY